MCCSFSVGRTKAYHFEVSFYCCHGSPPFRGLMRWICTNRTLKYNEPIGPSGAWINPGSTVSTSIRGKPVIGKIYPHILLHQPSIRTDPQRTPSFAPMRTCHRSMNPDARQRIGDNNHSPSQTNGTACMEERYLHCPTRSTA